MYFEKDYILRIIDMMAEFFRRLLELASKADQEEALNAFCMERCGLSLDAAKKMDIATLRELLSEQACFYLSEALYMDSKLQSAGPAQERSADLSLRLLATLSQDETLCAARAERLKELVKLIQSSLTPEDYIACARFFETGLRFDYMEDMIFLAAENSDNPKSVSEQGLDLFYMARTLPDEVLIMGGLPKAELNRSIQDFKRLTEAGQ